MGNENERSQSEFNMAVSYLNRLNTLFSLADESAIQLDIYTWFHTLMSIQRELSTEMKEEEIKFFNKIIDDIQPSVQKAVAEKDRTGKTQISHELYRKMHNFEIDLRSILKDSGLLMKMKDSAMDALK